MRLSRCLTSTALKLAAVEILVGHWDNYIGNQNNFYHERLDGRLMMISYDVDNTLGSNGVATGQTKTSTTTTNGAPSRCTTG